SQRSSDAAVELCAAVTARNAQGAPLDHRVLYRLHARLAGGAAALAAALAAASGIPLVSHEDHTPGQGQYADRRHMERYLAGMDGLSAEEAARRGGELVAESDAH